MKKQLCIIFLNLISYIAIFTNYAFSNDNLIPTALEARPTIVEVLAQQIELYKTPNSKAAIDPNTGRIMLTQQAVHKSQTSHGAGVIIDPSGIIVTNLHTIFQAQNITIKFSNGLTRKARIIKLLPSDDLALLKVSPISNIKAIHFADSNKLSLGDEIIQIGNSYLLKGTISSGRIVGLAKPNSPDKPDDVELIKIDINLYKGDSGGPVLNKNGELIGMIEARFVSNQGLTLAIPSNKIKKLYIEALK